MYFHFYCSQMQRKKSWFYDIYTRCHACGNHHRDWSMSPARDQVNEKTKILTNFTSNYIKYLQNPKELGIHSEVCVVCSDVISNQVPSLMKLSHLTTLSNQLVWIRLKVGRLVSWLTSHLLGVGMYKKCKLLIFICLCVLCLYNKILMNDLNKLLQKFTFYFKEC